MRILFIFSFLIVLSISYNSHAYFLKIHHPCDNSKTLVKKLNRKELGRSIYATTIEHLETRNTPFTANGTAISSIFNTVLGLDAHDVDSDPARFFGWCYIINGSPVEMYSNEVIWMSPIKTVDWFYGFAEHSNGVWLSYCNQAEIGDKHVCIPQPISNE